MPQQSGSQVRVVDPVLSNFARGYGSQELIGTRLMPRVNVRLYAAKALQFGKEHFRLYNTSRAPGTRVARVQLGYSGDPYAIQPRDIEVPVPIEHMTDASNGPGVDLGSQAAFGGQHILDLELESMIATKARNAAAYQSANKIALAGTDQWSDANNSNPGAVINTGREAIRASVGMYPNVAVVPGRVLSALQTNAKILDRTKYSSKDSITAAILAALWDIETVLVGKAITFDDAGNSTDVWGRDVLLAYVPPAPPQGQQRSMYTPAYGYTYTIEGMPAVFEPYWDNSVRSWVYPMKDDSAPVLTSMQAGYLIQNAVA